MVASSQDPVLDTRGKFVLYRNPPPPYMVIDATQGGAGKEGPPSWSIIYPMKLRRFPITSGGDLGNGRQNILPGWQIGRVVPAKGGTTQVLCARGWRMDLSGGQQLLAGFKQGKDMVRQAV